eukprot:240778-Chlamydomonas_euryale.AAC.3
MLPSPLGTLIWSPVSGCGRICASIRASIRPSCIRVFVICPFTLPFPVHLHNQCPTHTGHPKVPNPPTQPTMPDPPNQTVAFKPFQLSPTQRARVWQSQGELESQKEALLKQVRGLTAAGFKSDAALFVPMASASLALCRTYVALFRAAEQQQQQQQQPLLAEGSGGGGAGGDGAAARRAAAAGGVRDLSAARLHLRGVLKQCEPVFGEHVLFAELAALLEEVEALLASVQ